MRVKTKVGAIVYAENNVIGGTVKLFKSAQKHSGVPSLSPCSTASSRLVMLDDDAKTKLG